MIKIGMMIGDRYEILEKIGTGGMSDVYKAKCHKLNRFVAVKVLKQEFSENANFVSKFRIEAQAAAGLMHPNIVNVYDVGEENGIYYIVMELVEGITLKKYIEKKARLSYKEAISIAIQICMGIESAHNNHIIHRDIKPQNIIISKDGKVKVTDFGIAKAATSNTITSNVMGSVHYTSPEQARGGYSDEKSDIYSLGISLFEMLTGRVPFNGETTVAIAIKHIQEEILSPAEYVPEIPVSVESIVLKCCQKSPDRRYQSMAELIVDLKKSLVNPDVDFVLASSMESQGFTRVIPSEERERLARNTGGQERKEEHLRLKSEVNFSYQPVEEVVEENDEEIEEDEFDDYDPKMEKLTTILAIVAGIIICIIVAVLAGKIFGFIDFGDIGSKIDQEESSESMEIETETGEESSEETEVLVEMIDVLGRNVEEVKKELVSLGLTPVVEYEESDEYEEGIVMNSNILKGDKVAKNSTVTLTVSSGLSGVEIPNLEGYSYEEAYNKVIGLGFAVNRSEDFSETVAAGKVMSQSPASGQMAVAGSVVTITVSAGTANNKALVPNLLGLNEDEAVAKIVEAGLVLKSVSQIYNSVVGEGKVCYQSYSAGTYVDVNTTIDINISLGAETAKYKCNTVIAAPTVTEAPDYVSGTAIKLKLVTDDGTTLLDTEVTSFPQAANYYGLVSSGGTLTMTYSVTVVSGSTLNEATGETIAGTTTKEEKSFTRRITFISE